MYCHGFWYIGRKKRTEQKIAYKTFGKLFNNSKQNFHLFPTKIDEEKKTLRGFHLLWYLICQKFSLSDMVFFPLRHAFPLSCNNKQNHRKWIEKNWFLGFVQFFFLYLCKTTKTDLQWSRMEFVSQ